MQKISVIRALNEAVTGLPRLWGGAWLILILSMGISSLQPSLLLTYGTSQPWLCGLLALASLVISIMTSAALYRVSVFKTYARAEGLGLGGVQIGSVEGRLIVAGLINSLFVFSLAIIMVVVLFMAQGAFGLDKGYIHSLAAMKAHLSHPKTTIEFLMWGYIALCALILVQLSIRLSLYKAATVAEHKIVALNALGLGEGQVWRLFLGSMAILVPFMIFVAIVHNSGQGGVCHNMCTVPALHAKDRLDFSGLHISSVNLLSFITHGLVIFFVKPAMVGYLTSVYNQIRADRPGS